MSVVRLLERLVVSLAPSSLRIEPDAIRPRNAKARRACRLRWLSIDGLEAALVRAHEIAVRDELDAVARYINEAQRYLKRLRILHQEALDELNKAQGE
jgi:hypothetical protein